MKKIALFVAAVAVSLSFGGRAFADTNTATLEDKAGITPDNIILYPIDKAIDNLKISITIGDEKVANVLLDVAEERLGEAEVMADKEKTDLSAQALNEYNDKITEAQDKVEGAIEQASTTTDSAVKLDDLNKLETTVADRQMKSIEVLKNVEGKVSGNAKETLALVIEMQTKKKEAIAAVAKERQALLETKKLVKEAEKSLDQAKKAGNEQAVKAAEDTLKQVQQSLATQSEKFNQVLAAKKEAMKGGVGQLKKQAKKDQKEQTKDEATSTNDATSEDKSTVTTPAQNSGTTTSTGTTANTTTQSTTSDNTTVTDSANPETNVKENKGQEMKANKENHSNGNNGQEMKANKENNSKH